MSPPYVRRGTVLEGQEAHHLQRALKPQVPDTRLAVDSTPSSHVMATDIPNLPPTRFCLSQWPCLSPSVHLFSSGPRVFTFLDENLACTFEFQLFSCATE